MHKHEDLVDGAFPSEAKHGVASRKHLEGEATDEIEHKYPSHGTPTHHHHLDNLGPLFP